MSDQDRAPGLKITYRADGSKKAHWVAANCSRHAKGYPIKTVTLTDMPEEQWPAECQRLHKDLEKWLSAEGRPKIAWTGTIDSLIEHYTEHKLSPYKQVKYNSRADYDKANRLLSDAVGARTLSRLTGVDFLQWEINFKKPAEEGDDPVVTRSHKAMTHLRRLLRWGLVLELPHCKRLVPIIEALEFEQPPERDEHMEFEQCQAIIAAAHELGHHALAFGQALQYELMFRQKDVIGEWIPITDMNAPMTGILHTAPNSQKPKRWDNGLTWAHIKPGLILEKLVEKTKKKTRVVAKFDLTKMPLVMAELERIPMENRVGPLIINEYTRLPYTADVYREHWREAADEANLPATLQNRDSRAGGITEATDALPLEDSGLELVRHSSTHKDIKTTARYSKNTLKKTSRVADIRVAARKKQEQ